MDQKTEIMVALGVAIGVNCIPCFDHLYSKIDTLKDNDKIGSWLFRIAYRLCMDHFRKESRNPPEEISNGKTINYLQPQRSENRGGPRFEASSTFAHLGHNIFDFCSKFFLFDKQVPHS